MGSGSHIRELNSKIALDLTKKQAVLTFEVTTPAAARSSTTRMFKPQFNIQQMDEVIMEHESEGGASDIITADWPAEYSRKVRNDQGHKAQWYHQ